jgi:hypothetical protein
MHDFLPPVSNLTMDFCHSKKMLDNLGMPYVKTDICHTKCMLHWKDDAHKDKCDFYKTSCYEEGRIKSLV